MIPIWMLKTHQTSSSQPYLMRSSSEDEREPIMHSQKKKKRHRARGAHLTLEFVLSDIDEAGRLDNTGGEVVHHLGQERFTGG